MKYRRASDHGLGDFHDIDKNGELALEVFNAYYRAHIHSGKLYGDFPGFFLVRPEVLEGREIATRPVEIKLIEECVKQAKARNGTIGVSKHRNPKLGYYWLELTVQPFILGDAVTANNKGEFFFLISRFIEFTKQNPRMYGDLTADIANDKDLALMFGEINKMAERLQESLEFYPEEMLVSYNPKWPVAQVNNLMHSLKKDNDQEWCEMFFEYLIYVMGKKSKS